MKRRERDLRQLIEPYGWRIAGKRGNGHYVLEGPGGATLTAAGSPSDGWRADANMLAWIRRINERTAAAPES
jgi:hypothetical protein